MKLSVIIVNYNVKHFLDQCLHSVKIASRDLATETIVVDNRSVDGSVEMVREKYPWVKMIANQENTGFSKANNQGIKASSGEYVLLLNPDTIVEHNTFTKIIEFMDAHPDAGGLGVKMVDGNGNFLPESKRGLPTPEVSFYKIFGLSRLFPRSKRFSKYHLGHLDPDETHEVEILAGAFMLLRRKVLEETGLLDETFFMYGEDIDLSYRIIKAGYKNYYFPETRIIHYKGESTKKGSINYVFVFYNAMIIFARKHFSRKNARLFSFFINIAIYFRASMAILNRFWKKALIPFLDAVMLTLGVLVIKNLWENNVVFPDGGHYPQELVTIMIPAYILIWLFSVFLSGGYDRPVFLYKILRGYLVGTLVILAAYGLLSEEYRFSRAVIVMGAAWGMLSSSAIRYFIKTLNLKNYQIGQKPARRFLVVANQDEGSRITDIIRNTHGNPEFIGLVSIQDEGAKKPGYLGTINNIKEIIIIYKINEIIFSAEDIKARDIIDQMAALQDLQVDYKIAPPKSYSIIGSNSITTAGDLYIVDINSIGKNGNRRNKRLLDFLCALVFLFSWPVTAFLVNQPILFLKNTLNVLFGKKTWVGYINFSEKDALSLPKLRKGVLSPADAISHLTLNEDTKQRLNLLYARNYNVYNDLNIILKSFKDLGRRS